MKMSLIACGLIVIAGVVMWQPIHHRLGHARDAAKQTSQALEIYRGLVEYTFENEGLFPSGESAEDCFMQLIDGGQIANEEVFWNLENTSVLGGNRCRPNADGVIDPGENVYGYVCGLSLLKSPSSTPLLFDSSDQVGRFNRHVWNGRAIIVRVNGATSIEKIEGGNEEAGRIFVMKGVQAVEVFDHLPEGASVLLPNR